MVGRRAARDKSEFSKKHAAFKTPIASLRERSQHADVDR
jgi:hypothetical protein